MSDAIDDQVAAEIAKRRSGAESAEREAIRRELDAQAAAEAQHAEHVRAVTAAADAGTAAQAETEGILAEIGVTLATATELVARLWPLHRAVTKAFDMATWAGGHGVACAYRGGSALPVDAAMVTAAFRVALDLARMGRVDVEQARIRAVQTRE